MSLWQFFFFYPVGGASVRTRLWLRHTLSNPAAEISGQFRIVWRKLFIRVIEQIWRRPRFSHSQYQLPIAAVMELELPDATSITETLVSPNVMDNNWQVAGRCRCSIQHGCCRTKPGWGTGTCVCAYLNVLYIREHEIYINTCKQQHLYLHGQKHK